MFTNIIKFFNRLLERLTLKQLAMLAIAAGIAMCVMVFFTLSRVEQSIAAEKVVEQQPAPIEMERVVVAKSNIKRGEIIQSNMLRTKEFAVQSLPRGTATDMHAFVGLPASVDIFPGDIITTYKVFTDIRQAGFIGMIPDNCRAITIPIDSVTGVAGLINPGNYVDLVLVTGGEDGKIKSEVLLQDILLLGIGKVVDQGGGVSEEVEESGGITSGVQDVMGQVMDSQNAVNDALNMAGQGSKSGAKQLTRKTPTGVSGATATLALTTDQVLKIIAAKEVGRIHLVLRPLKPTSDSMYFSKTTEYFGADGNETEAPKEIKKEVEKIEMPTESQEQKSTSAFEVIQWGN